YWLCMNCQNYRPRGAFPHLIGEKPCAVTESAKESIAYRNRNRKMALKNCGLADIYSALCSNYYNSHTIHTGMCRIVEVRPARERAKMPAGVNAKLIKRRLPVGGCARELRRTGSDIDHSSR